MKLLLMRHGKYTDATIDPELGLSDAGKVEIERLAKELSSQGVSFSQVFHSEKKRARETAEIMARFIAPGVSVTTHKHIKPNDDPAILLEEISLWHEDTLVASHLPFVPSLLARLTSNASAISQIGFEPGTIVSLSKSDENNWQIDWVAAP